MSISKYCGLNSFEMFLFKILIKYLIKILNFISRVGLPAK